MLAILISVRFHNGRYHGTADWPPSPARLFQALVAAAANPGLDQASRESLAWLEDLNAPSVAAPAMQVGQHVALFVPNNDLDAKGGDIRRVAEIRGATKRIRPRLFDANVPLLYAWQFDAREECAVHAGHLCTIAERLYQLGRGVDMAWALAEVIDSDELERRLEAYPGAIYRPCDGGEGAPLDCPEHGSLDSLCERQAANGQRFASTARGTLLLTQAPKPRFRSVRYNSPTTRLLFDLRDTVKSASPFAPWPLTRSAELVQRVRGEVDAEGVPQSGATRKLWDALPDLHGQIASALIGRHPTDAEKSRRVRIVPLPSIGHAHASRDIRRVLVEIPSNCPLRPDDIAWAFSGLELSSRGVDIETGEIVGDQVSVVQLVRAVDDSMLAHYGIGADRASRVWRSVTPIALPESAARRHSEPARLRGEAKGGQERLTEHQRAASAVLQALRHAGVRASAVSVNVRREPFETKGSRVELFSPGTRFAKERLWHVEITFAEPTQGPLILGDGRYAGLGLMAPVSSTVAGVHAFSIVDGLAQGAANTIELARALRRAVMARVQEVPGAKTKLSAFFSGHAEDGTPARRNAEPHLAFAFDATSNRLLVIAPHVLERRSPRSEERNHLSRLDAALNGFRELLAGSAGRLCVAPSPVDDASDMLFGRSREWASVTPYVVTRHAKEKSAVAAIVGDVRAECRRVGLPEPRVEASDVRGIAGLGLTGNVRLTFQVAVAGPISLGRDRHFGGGLFGHSPESP